MIKGEKLMEARKASDVFFHGDNEFFLLSDVVRAGRTNDKGMVVWFRGGTSILKGDAEVNRFTKAFAKTLDLCEGKTDD